MARFQGIWGPDKGRKGSGYSRQRQRQRQRQGEVGSGEGVGDGEAAELEDRKGVGRGDVEGLDAVDGGVADGGGFDDESAGGGGGDGDVELVVAAGPTDEVVAGGEGGLGDAEGDLGEQEVGVLAVGRVAGSDEQDACDDVAVAVGDAGGSAGLGLDALVDDGGARGEGLLQFGLGGGVPVAVGLGESGDGERQEEKEEQEASGQLGHGILLVRFLGSWR